jgi:hypothetical protein
MDLRELIRKMLADGTLIIIGYTREGKPIYREVGPHTSYQI